MAAVGGIARLHIMVPAVYVVRPLTLAVPSTASLRPIPSTIGDVQRVGRYLVPGGFSSTAFGLIPTKAGERTLNQYF